jgi:glycosyltransferase involved in cell wall biosynthesis
VAKIDIPFRLLILGTGSRKDALERIIRNRNLQDRVEIKADVADVNRYLSHADIFILSSRWEGLSISILEAMRAALPVVATKVGGNVDAVVHGHTGILTPPNDPAKLASAIEVLLSDRKKAAEMGKAGRKRFLRLYTSDKMLIATERVYQQLLK